MLLGIFLAVAGSVMAPRGDRIWFRTAAVLIPAAFIFAGRFFGPK